MKQFFISILFILGLCASASAESSKEYYEQASQYLELAKQCDDEIKYYEAEIAQLQCMMNNDHITQSSIKQKERHIKNCLQKAKDYRTKANLLKAKAIQLAEQGK